MKKVCMFALFSFNVVVNGAWWFATIEPIALSFGAAFAALNLDLQPFLDINWKNLLVFKKDY